MINPKDHPAGTKIIYRPDLFESELVDERAFMDKGLHGHTVEWENEDYVYVYLQGSINSRVGDRNWSWAVNPKRLALLKSPAGAQLKFDFMDK